MVLRVAAVVLLVLVLAAAIWAGAEQDYRSCVDDVRAQAAVAPVPIDRRGSVDKKIDRVNGKPDPAVLARERQHARLRTKLADCTRLPF
jgi:hypothetical protein